MLPLCWWPALMWWHHVPRPPPGACSATSRRLLLCSGRGTGNYWWNLKMEFERILPNLWQVLQLDQPKVNCHSVKCEGTYQCKINLFFSYIVQNAFEPPPPSAQNDVKTWIIHIMLLSLQGLARLSLPSLPTIDYNVLTSILLVKAAFILGTLPYFLIKGTLPW